MKWTKQLTKKLKQNLTKGFCLLLEFRINNETHFEKHYFYEEAINQVIYLDYNQTNNEYFIIVKDTINIQKSDIMDIYVSDFDYAKILTPNINETYISISENQVGYIIWQYRKNIALYHNIKIMKFNW